ncbi:MAG: 2-C-methyl-D-erythritol 4-phosphate cytidylyltransferase [Chitinophagaceae bacterium]
MKKFAVIVAAGSGSRMQSTVPKQFLELKGKPVLWYTMNAFLQAYDDMQVVLVLPAKHFETGNEIIQSLHAQQRVKITEGGETRFNSVKNGLLMVDDDSIVFVHDAVRCLVSTALIQQCYQETLLHGNAVPAVHAIDSIRIDQGQGPVQVDRNQVYLIQTPQTFKSDVLKHAFEQPYSAAFTDEASVAESIGIKVHLIDGDPKNMKITRPVDLIMAEALMM